MKKSYYLLCVISCLILSVNLLYSQEKEGLTYRVKSGKSHPEFNKYQKAFENANWNCHRIKNQSRVIEFDNGIGFELFSALTAIKNGAHIPTNCLTNPSDIVKEPIYTLSSNGYILEGVNLFSSGKEIEEIRQKKSEKNQ
jgi:hypothetical protein